MFDFCVLCGNNDASLIESHHVVPRALGGEDNPLNIISLCSPCHARIHELGLRRGDMKSLQAKGIAAAKLAGKYTGRVPSAFRKADRVMSLLSEGLTPREVAKACSIGVASVYRIKKKNLLDTIAFEKRNN